MLTIQVGPEPARVGLVVDACCAVEAAEGLRGVEVGVIVGAVQRKGNKLGQLLGEEGLQPVTSPVRGSLSRCLSQTVLISSFYEIFTPDTKTDTEG
jgi:hypothetical protein